MSLLKSLVSKLKASTEQLETLKKESVPKSEPKEETTALSGKFDVTGWKYLPLEVRKRLKNELKVGDSLVLVPDLKNEYDKDAIRVMWNDVQIGWYSADGYRKKAVKKLLLNNIPYKCNIVQIYLRSNGSTLQYDGKYIFK